MSNDINHTILVGRLTREPELKSTPSGAYLCNFSIAVNRTIFVKDGDNKEEVNFFNCTAWGKLGEMISKYAQKGKRVGIDGHLRENRWEDQEGKKRSAVNVIVENFQFLDVRGETSEQQPEQQPEPYNDDIPF